MLIRNMMLEDVEKVWYIEQAVFSQPWSRQGFVDALNLKDTVFLVAEGEEADQCNGAVLGYLGMYVSVGEGEITNVAVDDRYRRKGVGEALLRHSIEICKKRGILRLVLEVRYHNEAAIRLYGKMGFSEVGIRKGFYEMPKEDARIMVYESGI